MWVFESRKIRNSFIATNPKVLTQTLLRQNNLERYLSKKRYLHIITKQLLAPSFGPEYILLVRNPYKRIESYFKEKLRQKVYQVRSDTNPYVLKRHQEIFFPYLDINSRTTDDGKVQAILEMSFKKFVSLLPNVYPLEDHLAPQTLNFTRSFLGLKVCLKPNKHVHIEEQDELSWLADYYDLDLSRKHNSSSEIKEDISWDSDMVSIVKSIYRNDFMEFGYDVLPPQ